MTAGPKRFYRAASVLPQERGYEIALDGRPIRTPGRRPFLMPGEALAAAIAAEWQGQGETLDRTAMPLLHLAYRAIDIVGPARARIVDDIAAFAGTDLLCYRDEGPSDLARRQHALWQPLLDWAAARYDAPLATATGVVFIEQASDVLASYRQAVDRHDDMTLAGLAQATETLGSLVLGLALSEGRIDAVEASALAELDEIHQMERWGTDAEALRRRENAARDVANAARFIRLARG